MDRRWRPGVAALALAIALVGAAGVVAALVGPGRGGGTGVAHPDLDAALPELIAFVEGARGLRFLQDVPVELLDDEAFLARLHEDDDRDPIDIEDDAEDFVQFLRVFGLVGPDVDVEGLTAAADAGIAGFYDAERDRLYVRSAALTPFARMVMVHELTHALEDQHFDLLRPDLDERDDEAGLGFTALVEGSAVVVEGRYYGTLSAADRARADEATAAVAVGGSLPSAAGRIFDFPYSLGPEFVDALLEAGGQARLDAAFADPPTTSEQILHPERYLAGEGARPVAEPRPDRRQVDAGALGEMWLFLVLDEVVTRAQAERAAAGWGGDRYVAWNQGGRLCVRWHLVMDSPTDTAEVLAALARWAERNPGATVSGREPVVVQNCA
jgi:hypothetical protein